MIVMRESMIFGPMYTMTAKNQSTTGIKTNTNPISQINLANFIELKRDFWNLLKN
jgi:hypothetical protein